MERENQLLERGMANNIWYISHFIEGHSSHEDFKTRENNNFSKEYYDKAYYLIHIVCNRFFSGGTPYIEDRYLDEEIQEFAKLFDR